VGLLIVSTPLVYAQESAAFEKIRDVFSNGKFTRRILCNSEPADPNNINPDLITGTGLVSLPSKTGRFQIT
jgi:hypothetical protein